MTMATFVTLWLTAHSYGPAQRDAVLWNATRESGMRSGAVSKYGDIGLFQKRGARARSLIRYAVLRGKHWTDPTTQLEDMDRELRSLPMARRFFALTSATAARALFCTGFEQAARCPNG